MKILFISGIRSEYDIIYSVLLALQNRPGIDTALVLTGAHLSSLYGRTADLAELDGVKIIGRIESLLNSDSSSARLKSTAVQLLGLVDVISSFGPQILVAVGDREEALTMAMAGAYMGIPVAHIGGGDFAEDGNVDNIVRDAVSKMAHIHFAASRRSGDRLLQLGEEPWRIHVVGAPGLDRFIATPRISRKEVSASLDFDITEGPILLVIQHSISSEIEEAEDQMLKTLAAAAGTGLRTLISYPNSDAGSHRIIKAIEQFGSHPKMKVYRSLPRNVFVNLLRFVDVLIGNSSCGIIEAPSMKLPVVNIGRRQVSREHAQNVIFVDHDVFQIQQAIHKALHDQSFRSAVRDCRNPYGDGTAGEKIAQALCTAQIDDQLLTKRLI